MTDDAYERRRKPLVKEVKKRRKVGESQMLQAEEKTTVSRKTHEDELARLDDETWRLEREFCEEKIERERSMLRRRNKLIKIKEQKKREHEQRQRDEDENARCEQELNQ